MPVVCVNVNEPISQTVKHTSRGITAHDVDHALTLTGRELGERFRQRRNTRPPVLLGTVALHRPQTMTSNRIQLPAHGQELEV